MTSFDGAFFLGNLMNNYSSKNPGYVNHGPPVELEMGQQCFIFLYVTRLMIFSLCGCVFLPFSHFTHSNIVTHSHVYLHSLQGKDEGDLSSLIHLLLSVP